MPGVGAHGKTCGHPARAAPACHNDEVPPRFLKLSDVQEILNISSQQAYALVRSGDLPAIQVGGRGQWRVDEAELESYIARQYAVAREHLREREAR